MHFRGRIAAGFVAAMAIVVAVGSAGAKERVWTSADGRTMRGEFVRELDGEVTFLVGGKLTTVPLERLAQRDQKIVRDLAAGKEVPDDPPPTAPPPVAGSAPAESSSPATPATPAAETPSADSSPPAASPPSLAKKPKSPVTRVWLDNQGRKTTAKFVRMLGPNVVLLRAGGTVTIGFFDLSEADQTYVKELLTARGQEELIPTAPPPPPANAAAPAGQPGSVPLQAAPGGFNAGTVAAPPYSAPTSRPPLDDAGNRFSSEIPFGPGPFASGPSNFGPGPAPIGENIFDAQQRMLDAQAEAARRDMERLQQLQQQQAQQAIDASASMFKQVPICSNCRREVTEEQARGTRCPHCGAIWVFKDYSVAGGSPTSSSSSSPAAPLASADTEKIVRTVIVVATALVVVVVLCGGVIAIAVAIASASRSGRQYRQMK